MVAFLIGALVVIATGLLVIGVNNVVVIFYRFLYFIGSWLLKLIEYVQRLFRKLCGLDSAGIDGNLDSDPLWALVNNNAVQTAFLSILFLSIILVFVFAMIQIIRQEYTTEGSKNAKGPIIKSAIKSIFFFAFIPLVSLIGIGVSNILIGLVEQVTNQGKATSIAGLVFTVAVENNDSNPYRACQNKRGKNSVEWSYNAANFGEVIGASLSSITQVFGNTAGYDDITGIKGEVTDSDGGNSSAGRKKVFYYEGDGKIYGAQFVGHDDWDELFNNDPSQLDAYFSRLSFTKDEGFSAFTVESKSTEGKAVELKVGDILNYTNSEAVYYFYNVTKIDYIILFLGGWFVLKALITSAFGVAMRIYKVVILFIISPYPVSLSVLDGGSALNKWKSSFLRELFSAYGVVVGLNLFLILFQEISENEMFEFFTGEPLGGIFNSLTRLVMLLIGCLMIGDIVGIISDFIGGGNAMKEGKGMQDQVTKLAAKAGTAAIGGLTLAAAGATAIGGLTKMGTGMLRSKIGHKATKADNAAIADEEQSIEDTQKEIDNIKLTKEGKPRKKLTKEQQEKLQKLEEKKAKHEKNLKEAKGRVEERNKRDEERIALGNRSFLRGKAVISNAIMGTKAFQYVNKSAYGMLSEKGRSDLDKQISGMSEEHASTMAAAKDADKRRPDKQALHRPTGAIRDFGRKVVGLTHITENATQYRTNLETQRKEREAVANLDVATLEAESVDFKDVNLAIEKNALSDDRQADIANNIEEYKKKADMFAPTTAAAEKEKAAYDLIKKSQNYKGADKVALLNQAQQLMKDARTEGRGDLVKFDPKTINEIKKAFLAGTTTARSAPMQFAKNTDQASNLNHIIQNSLSAAIAKVQNAQGDAKTANSLQELIRTLIDEVKRKR